eukprot:3877340-Pleurochrysis_carterae.AAC.5
MEFACEVVCVSDSEVGRGSFQENWVGFSLARTIRAVRGSDLETSSWPPSRSSWSYGIVCRHACKGGQHNAPSIMAVFCGEFILERIGLSRHMRVFQPAHCTFQGFEFFTQLLFSRHGPLLSAVSPKSIVGAIVALPRVRSLPNDIRPEASQRIRSLVYKDTCRKYIVSMLIRLSDVFFKRQSPTRKYAIDYLRDNRDRAKSTPGRIQPNVRCPACHNT